MSIATAEQTRTISAWQSQKLSDVATIVNGGTPKSKVAEYWGGSNQWLTPADMGKMEGREISATPRTITDEGLAKSSARLVPPESVILSTRAPIGHLAVNSVPMAFNQGCRGLVPNDSLDHVFLYYFLQANRDLLNELGTGTTFKELSATNLKTVKIPLPPLEEQKRIVAVLDKAFAALDRARTLAEANLADAEEFFPAILTAKFSSNRGFATKIFEELCEKITDGTHQTPKYFDSGYTFLSSKNVTSGKIDWENVKYIDEAQHIAMHKRLAPKPGDILLAKNGTTGVAAIVDRDAVFDIYVSLALLRSRGEVLPELLLYFINSSIAKKQFNARLKGTGVPNLHLKEIRQVRMSYPEDVAAQKKLIEFFDARLADCERIRERRTIALRDLADLRQSLLQKAFAGELT